MSKVTDGVRPPGSHGAERAQSGQSDPMDGGTVLPVENGAATTAAEGPRHSRRAAAAPVDAVPEARHEHDARARDRDVLRSGTAPAEADAVNDDGARVEVFTRRQLRLQQVDGRAVLPTSSTTGTAAPEAADASAASEPAPGGRRDRRRSETTSHPRVPSAGAPPRPAPGRTGTPGDLTIEAALAARNALAKDASDLADTLAAHREADPFAVDPDLLAQQQALAQRASLLNARARLVQERSDPNPGGDSWRDPTTPCNLSILTPPEFVSVPGGSGSVLRAPATSHIPIVVPSHRSADRTANSGAAAGGQERAAGPVRAQHAFGLDPLDAMTAGLGRRRRIRYIQYSMIAVGAAALATGIMMTVGSLNG
ncbi:hypothetical protein FJV46_12085 [Arthrobacter agilis]|uniref:hypothetical protein n=1 Tax=Arthrobacter agilis TaxID=37921 RepID=UPI000F6F061E|nr:hypothetical protein [Arthrobacter agilis]TPV23486.1 hypothetical protein FJV46_12085 [Arthrobacter agilis]VDR31880.1 Uncharacterised protein [Arthrobacter agilis]